MQDIGSNDRALKGIALCPTIVAMDSDSGKSRWHLFCYSPGHLTHGYGNTKRYTVCVVPITKYTLLPLTMTWFGAASIRSVLLRVAAFQL